MASGPSPRAGRLSGGTRLTRVRSVASPSLRTTVLLSGLLGLVILAAAASIARAAFGFGASYPVKASAVFGAILAIVLVFVRDHHPFPRFGAANYVTLTRAILVALLVATLGEPTSAAVAFAVASLSGVVPMLDGVDGYLARRSGMASPFGARFDMEIDALHVLVLSGLLWHFGKAGPWIFVGGLLRYAFVAAGRWLPWMSRELRPTLRGRAITIVHMATVSVALAPFIPVRVAIVATALTTSALVWSFGVDIGRLWRGEGAR